MGRRRSCFPRLNEGEKQGMKLSRNRYGNTASGNVSLVWQFLCETLLRVLAPLRFFPHRDPIPEAVEPETFFLRAHLGLWPTMYLTLAPYSRRYVVW